ncbi:MAG: phosphatase PAP2 family protein [Chloroflexi bacterium]|nr:phosphatase PAP2 family protein [Chloroflexota bacterium]
MSWKAPVAVVVSLVIAAALTLWVSFVTPLPGDVAVSHAVQSVAAPWLDAFMGAVSFLSDDLLAIGSVLAVAAALAAWRRWPETVAFLGVLAADVALRLPKVLVDRGRPTEELVHVLERGSGGGFPSAHAYHMTVFVGLVLLMLAPRIPSAPLRWAAMAALVALIVLTGVSRVYLGAHWPSDVLGAFAYGIPSVAALAAGYRWLARRLG